MNKRIVIGLFVFTFVVIGYFVAADLLSYRDVFINFKSSDVGIKIYNNNSIKEVVSLGKSSEVRLKDGSYYYLTSGQKYGEQKIYFEVRGDSTVDISPPYSDNYLSEKLKLESTNINKVISLRYSDLIDSYIIADERLHNHGEWYSAKLIQNVTGSSEPDVYRLVMSLSKDRWDIVVSPRLVVNYKEFGNIPNYIIRQVNLPLSTAAYDLLYP